MLRDLKINRRDPCNLRFIGGRKCNITVVNNHHGTIYVLMYIL